MQEVKHTLTGQTTGQSKIKPSNQAGGYQDWVELRILGNVVLA